MSKPKHTPGPWEVEDYRDKGDWRSTGLIWARNMGDYHPGTAVCKLREDRLHDGSPPEKIAEFEANAHLIAAAPDLLEALKSAQEALEHYAQPSLNYDSERSLARKTLNIVEMAIAKAEGRDE